jgi:fatty acid desaturase
MASAQAAPVYPRATWELLQRVRREPGFGRLAAIPAVPLPTIALIVAAYALVAGGTALYLLQLAPYWVVLPLNVLGIYFAFTPLHDASHRAVSSLRWLNNGIGNLGALLLLPGFTTDLFRGLHMQHHRHTGEVERDPDEVFVSAPLWLRPFTWVALDGVWSYWYFAHWRERPAAERRAFVLGLCVYAVWHIGFLASPYAREFLLLWLVPQRLTMFVLLYFFAYIQHPRGTLQKDAPLQATVMLRGGGWLYAVLLAQSEHLMHHLFPSLPFYRYHAAWRVSRQLLETQPLVWRGLFRPASAERTNCAADG